MKKKKKRKENRKGIRSASTVVSNANWHFLHNFHIFLSEINFPSTFYLSATPFWISPLYSRAHVGFLHGLCGYPKILIYHINKSRLDWVNWFTPPPPKVNYSLIMNLFIPYNTSIFYKGIFFPFREKAGSDVSSIKQDTFRHLVRRSQCQVAGPAWVPPAAEAYLQPEEQHVLNWTSN